MAEPIHILICANFTDAQLARLREVSARFDLVQKTPARDSDDTSSLFTGNEEIFCGFRPPKNLAVAPNLKWVQLLSAGINQALKHPLWQSQIQITTSSGIHATPIAEFALAMMLALARKIPRLVQLRERSEWPKDRWQILLGSELRGKTLGIVGYGSIGREVARIATRGFGMRIVALKRGKSKRDDGYREAGVGDPQGKFPELWFAREQLNELLTQSDFVLISAPLTDETRLMIGETQLRAMKPSAFLLNIARGELIDEVALAKALRENWIAGAGLDVFAEEPLPRTSPLWKFENVIISPHASAATPHYDDRAVELFAENLRRYLAGKELLNSVDRNAGY